MQRHQNPVRQRDLIQTIAKALRVPRNFYQEYPKFLMSITLGEMHKLVFDSIYAKPERLLLSCRYLLSCFPSSLLV